MHPERNCGHVAFWHLADTERCPVLRDKRTLQKRCRMSDFDPNATSEMQIAGVQFDP
jgi:hypothetical protein